jgi:hypothetical protein
LIYENRREIAYYFEKKNQENVLLFELIGNCPSDAFIKQYSTLTVEVFQEKENYLLRVKSHVDRVECMCRYRGFTVADFIVADRITLYASTTKNDTSVIDIRLERKDISTTGLILDTVFSSMSYLTDIQFSISKIEYHLTPKSQQHLKEGMQRIDNYFLFDSLATNWQKQLDMFDLSNIDMIPIYPFQLKDVETEIKQYDSNEYEVLLVRSAMDNRDYLQKRSSLFGRIEDIKLDLSRKIKIMDELMFEKAKRYEEEHNLQKAIFYYTRTLDYNPLHCDALERLSDLYTQHNLHQENIDLFTGLRIRGEDISCEASLSGTVCDSMSVKATSLIEQRNYYDAVKLLDTMELLLYQIPDTTCFQTYLRLRTQAQEGIYNSYFEVIKRAIKSNKIDICKEYIYGLVAIMEKDGHVPFDNKELQLIMDNFISRHKENTSNRIRKKNYAEVIQNNDATLIFLDSVRYSYDLGIFTASYTTSCTALYYEKKKQSEEIAAEFFNIYRNYIVITAEIPVRQESITVADPEKTRKEILVRYVLNQNIIPDDFSMLDSIAVLLQLKDIDFSWDSLLIEQKIIPLLMNALLKVNHYSWTNELFQANELMKKINTVVSGLDLLTNTSDLSMKYNQTKELLFERINQRAALEFDGFLKEIRQLILQKEYLSAYQLLKNNNLLLETSQYRQYMVELEKEVEQPAFFQEKMVAVEQDLAMEDYLSGFSLYEEAHVYFLKYGIVHYGLSCDSLPTFIRKHEQEKFLRGACSYYMEKSNYAMALNILMYLIDLGYKSEDLQVTLGEKMKRASYNFDLISREYVFTKVHKPFLKHFRGALGYFWYYLRHGKLFNKYGQQK